ncbi:hypothetical protein STCU_09463 [Strigomonas culicis]|uniref:Uncharacterized protein n=1 Tax=Strigomonas culicis TaxID=28005 RepID=S9V8Z8_9TRYP|nr:hypothetical protein STCU_09463 [Strigomonas culicis]|eukprot:EPY19435.1 hypothetical protein STCU_09463 [Strigomonas culicis]
MERYNPAMALSSGTTHDADGGGGGGSGARLQGVLRWWDSWRLNLSAAAKVDGGADARVPLRLVEANLSVHNKKTEQRLDDDGEKVVRCSMGEESLQVRYGKEQDPRYTGRVTVAHHTVDAHDPAGTNTSENKDGTTPEPKAKQTKRDILSVQWQEQYDSAKQTYPLPPWWPSRLRRPAPEAETDGGDAGTGRAPAAPLSNDAAYTYSVQADAGPGLEMLDGATATVYAAVRSQAHVEVPLPRRFSLLLRNQSSLVCPFVPLEPAFIACDDAAEEKQPVSGWRQYLRPHDYFWATQGPKWEANLVRGFSNDYSSMHHAKYWYSVFSAELGRDKQTAGSSEVRRSFWQSLSKNSFLKAFFNVCFTDTLREYPRASVGVSVTSDVPRLTVDVFNNILPNTFECSFSWFVDFDKRQLKRGLQPGAAEEAQFIRISPSETFRHMKCGATWKFE